MSRARSVDDYIANAEFWQEELARLRDILRATPLGEDIKWGAPCYTHKGKNVVGIGGFKSYFGLWFHQGALLEDDKQVLINAQEGKTKALRQWRMTSRSDIKPATIRRYVREATALVDQGKAITASRGRSVEVPAELGRSLQRTKGATAAFRQLRPGPQNATTPRAVGSPR